MEVGLYVDLRLRGGSSWREIYSESLELIEEADRGRVGSVWLTEHHFFDDGYVSQPLTVAAAVAARTRRLRIGVAVLLLPLHSAIEVAEQAATVDILSGGRLELGLGVGYRPAEFAAFGVDASQRYVLYKSRVEEMRALWGEAEGPLGMVMPPPIQRPLPLWSGFVGPVGARRAGRLRTGLILPDITRAGEVFEDYQAGLRVGSASRVEPRCAGLVEALLSTDPERAWARSKEGVVSRWNSYAKHAVLGTEESAPDPIDPDQWRASGRVLVGTPGQVADHIKATTAGVPVEHVLVWADFPGAPRDVVEEHVRLAAGELAELLSL